MTNFSFLGFFFLVRGGGRGKPVHLNGDFVGTQERQAEWGWGGNRREKKGLYSKALKLQTVVSHSRSRGVISQTKLFFRLGGRGLDLSQ